MTVTVASFRGAFPAFSNISNYPDAAVQMWLDFAAKVHSVERWGDLIDMAFQLFTAHNLVLEYSSNKAGVLGQPPGQIEGPVVSGSVDKVSYSRNPSPAMDAKDGHWNLSTYGIRYIRMARMVGAGPMQIGVPTGAQAGDSSAGAWPGPILGPY